MKLQFAKKVKVKVEKEVGNKLFYKENVFLCPFINLYLPYAE